MNRDGAGANKPKVLNKKTKRPPEVKKPDGAVIDMEDPMPGKKDGSVRERPIGNVEGGPV